MTSIKEIKKPNSDASPYMRDADTRTNWEKFKFIVWDPEHKKFLRRTGLSWAKILFFFVIFYGCLCGMFAISMQILFACISEVHPTYMLNESRIGSNPGVGFRPISTEISEGALIWFSPKDEVTVKKWVDLSTDFLHQYYNNQEGSEECDFNKPPSSGKVCKVDAGSWHPCTANESFSFVNSSPCFFVKINRIYGWIPEVYNDTSNLPKAMPQDLKDYIASLPPEKRNQVWVSCLGENPVDKELLPAEGVEYIAGRGFPIYYYPYTNTPGFLSPLVVIRLKNPPLHRIINVECRAWAKNIKYVGGMRDRQGSVHFEVMID